MALVIALGVTTVLSLTVVSVIDYTAANSRSSNLSSAKTTVFGTSRMYVAGNLCLSPSVQLAQSTVIVGGNLDVSNNAAVGADTNMNTRVETYVGNNCRYGSSSRPGSRAPATRTRITST